MTDWYVLMQKVQTADSTLNHLVFSRATKTIGYFAGKRGEKIVVHVTVGTKRGGDSWRTCANDEYVARTTACFESIDRRG